MFRRSFVVRRKDLSAREKKKKKYAVRKRKMYKSLKKHGGPQVGPKKQKMGEKDHFPHAKLQNKLATTPTDQPANTATFAAPEGTFPAAAPPI